MNNINTTKPITLLREDFITSLVNLCNDSGLPFFVIEDVLKGLIQETHAASRQQLEADKKHYQEQLEKAKVATEKAE